MQQYLPIWLDNILIAPFRLLHHAEISFWLGCALLALYCVAIGKAVYTVLQKVHGKYYAEMQNDMQRYHHVSMNALHAGNKEAYFAANKMAHENFGKHFFARASISMASLVPVPFALSWLSLRFEGIHIYSIPYTELTMGYVFIFLSCYIFIRIAWSRLA